MPLRATLAPFLLVLAFAVLVEIATLRHGYEVLVLVEGHLVRNIQFALVFASIPLLAVMVARLARSRIDVSPVQLITAQVQERWRTDRLLSIAIPPLFLALLLGGFSIFKQRLLPGAGFGLDPIFAEMDRLLFLGIDPWRITHGIASGAWATQLMDWLYMIWFLPMAALVLLSWALPAALRVRTLLCFALVWIVVGGLLAYLLPAAGPCYYAHFHPADPSFAEMNNLLAAQHAALSANGGPGLLALHGQAELLSGYQSRELMLAGGISAMPSVHNAVAVLLALVAFRLHRAAGWLFTAFAGLIFFGSVHLGWHYAVDGIVAALATLGLWRLSGTLTRMLLRQTTG